jgi:hypothetical protein
MGHPIIDYCATCVAAKPVVNFKERRMKFREPTKLHRKIGGVGHPAISAGIEPKTHALHEQMRFTEVTNPSPEDRLL